jgi:hypothetical protein
MQTKIKYKLVPADKFSRRWKRAKAEFERLAEDRRPKPTKQVQLFGVKFAKVRVGTGIEPRLKTMEALVPKAYNDQKSLNKLHNEQALLAADVVKYVNLLESTIRNAPAGVDKVKLTTGADHLRNEMAGIQMDIIKELNKLKNALGLSQSFKFAAESLGKNIRLTVAKALAFIDDVRLTPTPHEFNFSISSVARGITQNIGNIDRLSDMGYEFAAGQPDHLFAALKPWANDGRKVEDDADREAVLAEVAHFETAVHDVANWARGI